MSPSAVPCPSLSVPVPSLSVPCPSLSVPVPSLSVPVRPCPSLYRPCPSLYRPCSSLYRPCPSLYLLYRPCPSLSVPVPSLSVPVPPLSVPVRPCPSRVTPCRARGSVWARVKHEPSRPVNDPQSRRREAQRRCLQTCPLGQRMASPTFGVLRRPEPGQRARGGPPAARLEFCLVRSLGPSSAFRPIGAAEWAEVTWLQEGLQFYGGRARSGHVCANCRTEARCTFVLKVCSFTSKVSHAIDGRNDGKTECCY